MNESELKHFGIKGMKWGQRRYQYKDGSLTPAGKKRYSDGSEGSSSTKSSKTKTKSVSEMSDDELRKAISRKQLEQQYLSYHPKQVSKGKKFVDTVLKDIVIPAAKEQSKQALNNYLNSQLKKAMSTQQQEDPYKKMAQDVKNYQTKKAWEKMQEELNNK